MTNQSGNDDKQLADQRCQQKDERECRQHQGQGRIPQYQRWHFAHCQRTGITTRFMLLYERIPVCKASVVLTLTSSCSSVSGLIAVSQNCGPL